MIIRIFSFPLKSLPPFSCHITWCSKLVLQSSSQGAWMQWQEDVCKDSYASYNWNNDLTCSTRGKDVLTQLPLTVMDMFFFFNIRDFSFQCILPLQCESTKLKDSHFRLQTLTSITLDSLMGNCTLLVQELVLTELHVFVPNVKTTDFILG